MIEDEVPHVLRLERLAHERAEDAPAIYSDVTAVVVEAMMATVQRRVGGVQQLVVGCRLPGPWDQRFAMS